MVEFIVGALFGAAALWGFLEYREYSGAKSIDPKDDEHIP